MITDKKILQSEVEANYVKSVSGNKLTGTVTENKNVFDKFPQLITNKFNALIDLLNQATDGDSGADNVKITSVTGRTATSVQGIIEELDEDIKANTTDKHTHANKSLLDTYAQTESDLADTVLKKHSHTNKSLLDSYAQTEANLSDAVLKKHAHANAELLNSYTQTEVDIADAVTKKHSHANKSLLDTYAQTESDLADAVTKKHTHSNKSVLDGITSSLLTALNGIATMFEGIVSVTTTLGADNTTIPTSKAVADAISVAGGGDMLKSSYDSNNTGNKVDKAIGDEDGANIKSTYATKTELSSKADTTALANKVDKVTGKGLSTNDYDNAEKEKVANAIPTPSGGTTGQFLKKTAEGTEWGEGSSATDYTVLVPTTWTGSEAPFTQTIAVQGITEADNPIYDIVLGDVYEDNQTALAEYSKIYDLVTSADNITLYATEATTVALSLLLKVVR